MPRILVADDNVEQVVMQQKLLESLGYQVGIATSPAAAIEEFERHRPDLLLVDLRFPEPADGLALIREIRQKDDRVPLIVLSGWPDELYGSPEEPLVSRVLVKGNVRQLLQTIAELLAA